MIIATHGIVASQLAGFDADAQAFFDRVTTAGGTLSATEKTAVNQLVLDLKSYSIWSKMKAIYPMVGASAAACAQNLKSSSFTGTFSGGWTYASTGVIPNGSTGYMDTGLKSNDLAQNSISGGVYTNTLPTSGNTNRSDVLFGSSNTGFSNGFYLLPCASGDTKDYSRCNTDSAPGASSWANGKAFFQMYRTSSSSYIVRRDSSTVTYSIASTPTTAINIYVSALNANSTLVEPSSNRIAYVYFGDGLTDTEAGNYNTIVQAFNTTLSRQN